MQAVDPSPAAAIPTPEAASPTPVEAIPSPVAVSPIPMEAPRHRPVAGWEAVADPSSQPIVNAAPQG